MAEKNSWASDIGAFFGRLRGQDRMKVSDKLTVLNTPISPQEQQTKQKIQSIVQYVRNKNWNRRHIEYFDEYRRMVATFPIIKGAIDIYAEEITTKNTDGNVITIKCEDAKVKALLEQCFFQNLKLNAKAYYIAREVCKFGNVFAYLQTRPKDGVVDMIFLPPDSIMREQMYDPNNLEAYRFNWYGGGASSQFEPWEIIHWTNTEDIEMMPYGVSVLRPIVDTWRRVVLIREALVIYRITRAPSKLLFKVGTDGLTGEEAFRFAQEMKKEVQKKPLINPQTGEIDFKYNPMPIAGYTPIPLLDGRTITIAELAKEYEEGKENFVYSVQDKTHQLVAGKVKWCGKNYTANKLVRVWLDNESYIDSAPEHPFMLRDGTKVSASDLKPGMSLMPFYQKNKKTRKDNSLEQQQVFNPATGKYEFIHKLVAKEKLKQDTQNVVHHYKRLNNSSNNLQWISYHKHKEFAKQNIQHILSIRKEQTNWLKNMSVHFDEIIWTEINKQILTNGLKGCVAAANFISANEMLMQHIQSITKRSIKLISKNIIRKEIKAKGFETFGDYAKAIKTNHKVDRLEILENVSTDVYCMTVVGLNGEEDRHNFAYYGLDKHGVTDSGSIVYNSIEENIFMPVYEGSPSDVVSLDGASNLDQVEDYKIIKDDLFAGLKIPKSWLTFEEDLSNKAALSEEDVRFAKTIQKHQAEFIEGLVQIGIVHLFFHGCSEAEMQSFTIEMNNPSTVSEKKKLELIQGRLEIAKMAWDQTNPGLNLMSYKDVLKNVLKFTDEEIRQTIKDQFAEKKLFWRLVQLYENGQYSEPEVEKRLAELQKMGSGAAEDLENGFDSIKFEGTIKNILREKIDEELNELCPPVKAKATSKLIRLITKGSLVENLEKTKNDFI